MIYFSFEFLVYILFLLKIKIMEDCEKNFIYPKGYYLGSGGYASVFDSDGKALKVSSYSHSWKREVKIMLLLNEYNIKVPKLFDYWSCEQQFYIIMTMKLVLIFLQTKWEIRYELKQILE
jgi:hypothetical protein